MSTEKGSSENLARMGDTICVSAGEPSERSIAETSESEPCWSERETNRTLVPPPTWSTLPSASATSARAGSWVFISSPGEIGRLRRACTSPFEGDTTMTSPLVSRTYVYALRL